MPARRIALLPACLALLAAPGIAQAGTPSAYVADGSSPGGISAFHIGSDGFLAPSGSASAGSSTQAVAATPDASHLYAASGGSIFAFSVASDGSLSGVGSLPAGTNMVSLAVSPDGGSLYAADAGGNFVYEYDIGPSGSLTPKSPARIATGTGPQSVAVSPDGGSVYAVDAGSHDVSQYSAGPGGVLAPKSPATVAAGTTPSTIALTPDGSSAYVTDNGGGRVLQYGVGANGTLSPRSPATVASGAGPTGIVVSPDGRSVYVSASTDATVWQYDVGSGGVLAPRGQPAGLISGSKPQQLNLNPAGRNLYVPDSASGHNVLYEFAILAGGTIDGSSPRFISAGSGPTAVTALPDLGPTASFSSTPGAAGSATRFDAGSSSDPDGPIAHYDWDFGDGTVAADGGPTPSHTYAQPASYTVKLTATDDAGCSTRQVFTGRTAYCNGTAGAVTTRVVNVAPVVPPVPFAGVSARNQTVKVGKKGLTWISVRCPGGTFGSCLGTLTLVSKGSVRVPRARGRFKRASKILLGQAGFNIQPGKAVRIPVQVSKTARKVLTRSRSIKGAATIAAHDRAMSRRNTAFSVRLKSTTLRKHH